MTTRTRQYGLSLVELMVAVTIGLVLSLGAVNLFMQSKASYLQDEESARLQENGRFALRYLSHELGMAGFIGGVNTGDLITSTPTGGDECFDYLMGVGRPAYIFEHYDEVQESDKDDIDLPEDECWAEDDNLFEDEDLPPPDVLVVRRTRDYDTDPDEPGVSLDPNAFYLRIFDANVTRTIVQGEAHGPDLEWWEFTPQILFVRNWSQDEGDDIPTLCRKLLAPAKAIGDTECLVEGVENMQIEYGVDSDGDQQANYFVANPTAAEMNGAVAARIYLLMRSVGEITGYTNDKTFTLGQTAIAASEDGYYRRVMQTTVLL
ncbi:MAG: prepilin-type N-terminal cleavage/methylation domain-containing protein, partial [Halioglobus sp.]|nr:prepilin-type N-terminal cleavage/methylation domain-containing protein [Halioglobus sp.]